MARCEAPSRVKPDAVTRDLRDVHHANDKISEASVGNAPVIRGMLAICFPNPLYKVAEVSQVRLRNVRAEMF